MFRLAADPQFTHTVPVLVPIDGGHREETMKVSFRVMPQDRHEALVGENRASAIDFLSDAVVRIEDVVDDDGKELPWSDELKAQLLKLPYVRMALLRAYSAALTKARAGN